MNFFKQLIKQTFNKRIKMLGRAGMIYKGDLESYFVDSELLVGHPDVAIFTEGIRFYDEKKKDIVLSEHEKKTIALLVKDELEAMGISVELS